MEDAARSDQVHLSEAVLCVECEVISKTNGNCPACGSSSVLSLARLLNRQSEDEEIFVDFI